MKPANFLSTFFSEMPAAMRSCRYASMSGILMQSVLVPFLQACFARAHARWLAPGQGEALSMVLTGIWSLSRLLSEEEFRRAIPQLATFIEKGLA